MFYAVMNGYTGFDVIEVIVEALSPENAITKAAVALKMEGNGPNTEPEFYTPSERWSCKQIALPYVVGT